LKGVSKKAFSQEMCGMEEEVEPFKIEDGLGFEEREEIPPSCFPEFEDVLRERWDATEVDADNEEGVEDGLLVR
jgi:hypothetical protein